MTRNKRLIICGLCVCMICAVATTARTIKNAEDAKSASVEYVNDDHSEILEHDGEVLVDSLKLTKVDDIASDSAIDSDKVTETVLSDDVSVSNDEYFEEVRATVDMDRNQIISMLSDVIAEAQSEEEKTNATNQKLQIIDYMNKEKLIENIIGTKGLPECLVIISDNAINVTVNKQDLAQNDVAKICDVVMRETGRNASQIVIQSKY